MFNAVDGFYLKLFSIDGLGSSFDVLTLLLVVEVDDFLLLRIVVDDGVLDMIYDSVFMIQYS